MKQPPLLLNTCTFKMKNNLKIFLILKNDTKTRAITNLYSSKYCCGKKLKTCQEWSHLVSGRFIKMFYKTTTCSRWPLLSGPKSGRLIYRFNCTASLKARMHLLRNWGQSNNVCLKWFFLIKQNRMSQTLPKYKGHNQQFLKSHKKWWYHSCK